MSITTKYVRTRHIDIYIYVHNQSSAICSANVPCFQTVITSEFQVSSPKKSLRSFSPHFRSCILWLQLPQLPPPAVTDRNESMSNVKVPNHFRFDIPWPRILKSLRFVAHRHRCPNPMPGFFDSWDDFKGEGWLAGSKI